MRVNGEAFRTIWTERDRPGFKVINQTRLPHHFEIVTITKLEDAARAIAEMWVRGAPLIGITAAYGLALAMKENPSDQGLAAASALLASTRPTAVNLQWALDQMAAELTHLEPGERPEVAFRRAAELADEDVALCESIGTHGLPLIAAVAEWKGGKPVNILTHCNAGWLATVDWGTATAPIYKAHDLGINLHVWVDETRPRNQGASLTAWEMAGHGVAHTVIADNAGGHLMQKGEVDLVIVGTDRTTAQGDVCNKIGTYLKALAAKDNGIPFYVAVPSPSIDFHINNGLKEIEIETRSPREVTHISGETEDLRTETIRLTPASSPALNHAFDVTPARLVTGLITERGIILANGKALAGTFPERVIVSSSPGA